MGTAQMAKKKDERSEASRAIAKAILEQYKPKEDTKVGIGTVISMAMPYSIFYLLGFTALLGVWSLLGLPLGPATPVAL